MGDDGGTVLAFLLVVFDVFVLLLGTTAASEMIGNGAAGTLRSGTGGDVGVGVEETCGVVALWGIGLLVAAAYVGFTLGCAAVGGSVGALGWGSSLWNVVARSWRCCRVSDAIGGRRVSVWVERRAAIRSLAAATMIWSRVVVGIFRLWGNI